MPPIAEYARCNILGRSNGSANTWAFGFAVHFPEGITDTDAQQVNTAVQDWIGANFRNRLSNSHTCTSVRIDPYLPGNPHEFTVTVNGLGARVGNPAGGQVAVIGTLRTNIGGRRGRGRIYFPGVSAEDINAIDGTSLDNDAQIAYQGSLSTLIASLNTIGHPMSVVSRMDAQGYQVANGIVRTYLGTQRRRVNNR